MYLCIYVYILQLIYFYKFKDATNCKFSILIDENNNLQFPSLIRMMQRMKVVISSDLLDKSDVS